MTGLQPALREKNRYLVFEVLGNASCNSAAQAVKESFAFLFGALEAAKASIAAVKGSGRRCLLRVNRAYVDKLRASLAMVKRVNDEDVILKSVGVSGSLKAAASKYLKRSVM